MPESNTGSANKPSAVDKSTAAEGDNDGRKGATLQKSGTWSKGGTWRRGSKATPVTQVAKESIFAATDKASEIVSAARNPITQGMVGSKRSPSTHLCRSIESPSRVSSLDASSKKTPVETASSKTAQGNVRTPMTSIIPPVSDKTQTLPHEAAQEIPPPKSVVESDQSNTVKTKEREILSPKVNADAPLWRTWFSRHEAPSKLEPEPPEVMSDMNGSTIDPVETPMQRRISNPELATNAPQQATAPHPWLGLWGTARTAKAQLIDTATSVTPANVGGPQSSNESNMPKIGTENSTSGSSPNSTTKAPGWAFWSRDTKTPGGNATDGNVGELALAGSPSQSHPESAVLEEASGVLGKRPRSVGSAGKLGTSQSQRQKIEKEVPLEPKAKVAAEKPIERKILENDGTKNLLLPRITATYPPVEKPSLMQSLSRWWYYDRSSGIGSVELMDNPPRIKRALTIGVHGYFPAPLIRSVLGQPTGTSIRFADGAANAIHKWTEAQGYTCDVEKVALEGEGKILERVEVLWKLLSNWTDNIRRADFIMLGCVQNAKIGVCAMAGVNLGPFIDYKSRWIGGSARELFDFAHADSQVSKDYNAALTTILSRGVRCAYVGSIDDQLVSLDQDALLTKARQSSTFGTIDHPNIYRAVFVDGRVHAPDLYAMLVKNFAGRQIADCYCSLTHLVGFALKLRNLGVADHGLIRELSSPLAGSLYSGEGHSKIYEDEAVLAVQNALQVTAISNVPLKQIRVDSATSQNPYILPFSLRGVLEESQVKNELQSETTELLQQFDEWKPTSKVLKDVKFRLEGVRSKL
ncbi:MAG: hypothetical protein Q9168_000617 [Polycauliona sp. 1 TL-2023]